MRKNQQILSMDYVYHDSFTEELKNVHVALQPHESGEHLDMKFTSADKIREGDLDKILNALWVEWFTRLKISPVNDCKIILEAAGKEYDVGVAYSQKISVTGITPR